MPLSARLLGQEYKLNAQEMNRVLVKLGFLTGKPGNYELTEKGAIYAIERDFHSGNGGYPSCNRYWTTRTYDDSIKDALNITDDLIKEVRDEMALERTVKVAGQAISTAKVEATKSTVAQTGKSIINLKSIGKIVVIFVIAVVVGYVIYKIFPKIKAWLDKCKESHKYKGYIK